VTPKSRSHILCKQVSFLSMGQNSLCITKTISKKVTSVEMKVKYMATHRSSLFKEMNIKHHNIMINTHMKPLETVDQCLTKNGLFFE